MRVDRAPLFPLRLDIDMDGLGRGATNTKKRSRDDGEDVVDEETLRVDKVCCPLACSNLSVTHH